MIFLLIRSSLCLSTMLYWLKDCLNDWRNESRHRIALTSSYKYYLQYVLAIFPYNKIMSGWDRNVQCIRLLITSNLFLTFSKWNLYATVELCKNIVLRNEIRRWCAQWAEFVSDAINGCSEMRAKIRRQWTADVLGGRKARNFMG